MSATMGRRSLTFCKRRCFVLTLATVLLVPNHRAGAGLGGRHRPGRGRAARSTRPRNIAKPSRRSSATTHFTARVSPRHFSATASLYLNLLNEPLVPLTLWKDLSESPVQLQKVGAGPL